MKPHPRVIVVGTSAAGKTTLASTLATRWAVPFVELDELYWGPDWTPKSRAEFERLVLARTECAAWVVAGNYASIRGLLWNRATTIIWLNYGLSTVFWRGLRRTFLRYVTREHLWHGNRESLSRTLFSRDSILYWILSTHRRRQREFRGLMTSGEYPHLQWIEFRHPARLQKWLDNPLQTAQ